MATELAMVVSACVASQVAAVAWAIRQMWRGDSKVGSVDESLDAKALELFRLRAEARRTAGDIETLERCLCLDRVRFDDVVDGTNLADWRCLDCGNVWSAVVKIPCEQCHPDALAAVRFAWEREKATAARGHSNEGAKCSKG